MLLALALHASTDLFSGLERRFYDFGVASSDRVPNDRLAVIAIDDRSIANIGRWPWPREVHAQLIDQLSAAGAKTIAHTAFFFEPQTDRGLVELRALQSRIDGTSSSVPRMDGLSDAARSELQNFIAEAEQRLDSDARLAGSMQRAGNVIVPSLFVLGEPQGRPDAPLPAFAQRNAISAPVGFGLPALRTQQPLPAIGSAAVAVAHLNQTADVDGVVRREPLFIHFDQMAIPSMGLSIAAHSLNLKIADIGWVPGEGIRLGNRVIPSDDSARVLPQFYRDAGAQRAISVDAFYDVISGAIPASKYADKIVIIGATAAGVGGAFATPVSASMSPAETMAHITSSILGGHFIAEPVWGGLAVLGVLLLVALYIVAGLPRLGAAASAWITAALFVALLGSQFVLLSSTSLWLPLVFPASLLLIGHGAITTRRFLATEAGKQHTDRESAETNRMMGLALQGQGQLDMAFDRFRRVPHSLDLMQNLQQLALDYERKRQFNKAEAVYAHMADMDPRDADVKARRARARNLSETVMLGSGASHPGGTLLLAEGGVEKPMLGRYQVEKELGKGAMGVVYQGRDPKIGRVVAIKTLALSAEFEGHELHDARQRFFREAETAGRLQHPHIVTIFDAGEDHDLAFIAMEFLQGRDLLEHTRAGSLLPVDAVIRIGDQVALALDYAHRQNVVHRDIKPANIMFDPASQSVKVTDFGIARITDASKTKTGMVMGTPSFMSPEQLAGQRVDGRSDLYSLGVTLYQLLTGSLPLAGDSMAALMYQIANQPAPSVRSVRPQLPQALADILDRLLAKKPDARFQTGAELSNQLREVLATGLHDTQDEAAPMATDNTFEKTRAWASGQAEATSTTEFETTAVVAQTNPPDNNNSAGLRGGPHPTRS
ncbi:CHASE2 domain-containing serine/threonine-protein kinase [Hydrogenophaga sp.]|uniref:CHASE2 domain-containing serine/threonine-protein kinase n=1 Tax=Hydrogenophaga sp. TaxID=1904254 RepID=UPI0027248CCE|nr:serine/threonine-protein kinase [Hydrogenophaga sp.]MDO8903194.1 serine/threonine-protein kinase [Hydrogenophaga sp.]